MSKHLSIRLPWHDRGWDGHVCDRPTANAYCAGEFGLKAHGIRELKRPDTEEGMKGKPVHALPADGYLPPCLRTVQVFGGHRELPFEHVPKGFLSSSGYPIDPVAEKIPPYSAGTWPYDQVFRANGAGSDVPAEFEHRYAPGEAQRNLAEFFDDRLTSRRSLAFFYLNYDNPLNSERRQYVLVGAAEIDAISPQLHWEDMDPELARTYGTMVWNRFVRHGYGDRRGTRLPYDRYLRAGRDASGILVEVSPDLSPHFKYVCRHFSDDEAAILLHELVEALERGKAEGAVDWDWDAQISWINTAIDRAWHDRGVFPGMGPVLEALGFRNATLYVERELVAKGVPDFREHVRARILDPSLEADPAFQAEFRTIANLFSLVEPTVLDLALDRLCLFELTTLQVKRILGNDLVPEAERARVGLASPPDRILANPYLILEEYDSPDRDDTIPFYRIDHGIFLARARAQSAVPGLDEFRPDDPRRLRAAALDILRIAELAGHTFLPQDQLLERLGKLQLPGLLGPVGAVTFARDLSFYQERLHVQREERKVAWQRRVTHEDEELIRDRIRKLRDRALIEVGDIDWRALLPEPDPRLPPAIAHNVAASQSEALGRLTSRAFCVLAGGAGTGKTTVIATLIKGLVNGGEKFVLLAPTGKAAVRMKRKIKDVAGLALEPRTIHSYLASGNWLDLETFRLRREGLPILDGASTVVIDECSMLDTRLLATVVRALDWRIVRRLILVGDPQQLPPIGLGAPFRNLVDMLAAIEPRVPDLCELTVNCRQIQEDSTALALAEVFSGRCDRLGGDEILELVRAGGRVGADLTVRFFADETDLPDALGRCLLEALSDLQEGQNAGQVDHNRPWEAFDRLHRWSGNHSEIRFDALEVLSPYRAGFFGSDALNAHLQRLLRSRLLEDRSQVKLGKPSGRRYVAPDKVLQVKNTRISVRAGLAYDAATRSNVEAFIANGELGKVGKIGKLRGKKVAWTRFEMQPELSITVDEAWAETELELGYAMTVHKAQGSDFGGIILVIPREDRQRMLSRELLYTALTRFKERLYILIQGPPGDIGPLFRGSWLGASDLLRRHTSLYGLREALPDLEDFRPEERIHRALGGELVRSKSEALIANELFHAGVPFYYEKALVAPDGSIRRPDFTIPIETPRGPAVLYWEHWGMLDDPGYAAKAERRRQWYHDHDFGATLIETDERGGFDSTSIRRIIAERVNREE